MRGQSPLAAAGSPESRDVRTRDLMNDLDVMLLTIAGFFVGLSGLLVLLTMLEPRKDGIGGAQQRPVHVREGK